MGNYGYMRSFRCLAKDAVYEQVRLALDAAWGYPNAETNSVTCFDPAAVAPRDAQRRILLAVRDEFVSYTVASEMLTQLLAGGAVEEIDLATYLAAVNPGP